MAIFSDDELFNEDEVSADMDDNDLERVWEGALDNGCGEATMRNGANFATVVNAGMKKNEGWCVMV